MKTDLNTSQAAKGALAHRLQRRTACNVAEANLSVNIFVNAFVNIIQNGRQGAPKWPTGSGKGSNPRFLGAPVNFR